MNKGTTTTTTIGQNISLDVAPVVEVITSEVPIGVAPLEKQKTRIFSAYK